MKLRIALAQINPTVGDLTGNSALILKYTQEAAASADVVVFSEMVLTGYPVEDLALRAFGKDRRLPMTSRWSEA